MAKYSGCFLPLLALAACSSEAPPPQPPPEVQILVVQPRTAKNVVELPGRVGAVRHAEVRARVDGIVERRLPEGTDVRAGTGALPDRPARAARELERGCRPRSRAPRPTRGQRGAGRRALPGARRGAGDQPAGISTRRSRACAPPRPTSAQARAQVEARAAEPRATRTVTAPIAGRAGRAQVTEGALVSAARHAADDHRAARSDLRELLAVELRPARDPPRDRSRGAARCRELRRVAVSSCSRTAAVRAGRASQLPRPVDRRGDRHGGAARASFPIRSASCCPDSSCARASRPACAPTASWFRSAPSSSPQTARA